MKDPISRLFALLAILVLAPSLRADERLKEVSFPGAGGLELRGTLQLPPEQAGPFTAVLLLPGSGPTDRNGNQPGLKIDLLKQIAEHLAREGFASMRFDKRAVAIYSEHWPAETTEVDAYFAWENFVDDAKGALKFLQQQPEVGRIVIAGHSEGGLIALQLGSDLAAPQAGGPAGLILLGTAGRSLDVVLREQIEASLARSGADPKTAETLRSQTDAAIKAVIAGEPLPEPMHPGLRPLFNPTVLKILRSYFTIDPADLAAAFTGPVLIVQGREDVQISAERDAPRLEAAFRRRQEGTVETVIIDGASHNLKAVEGNPMGFTGPIVPEVLDVITRWLKALPPHTAPDAPPPAAPTIGD